MDLENTLSARYVRSIYTDMSVETTRSHQSRVKDIGAVSTRQHNDMFLRAKSIHLHEKLI